MSGIGGSEDEPMNPNLLDPVLRGSLEREPAGPDDHASQQKGSANTEHARFSWLSQSDRQMTTREDLHRSDPQDKLDFVLDGLPDATSKLLSDIAQQTVPQCCEFPHTTFPHLGDPFQAWPFRDGVDCSKVRMEFFKMVREVRFILVRTGRGDIPLEEWFPPSGCPLTSSLCFESTYPSTKRSNSPALQFMFAAYTGDLDESIFFFDRWPIVTPTAGRFAKHADAVRRWGEQVVSRIDQFTAWCRSTCVAPVSIVAGSELQKDMIASAVEFVAIAEVSSIRTSEEFPVNLAILQHLDRYQLGVPLPHGQKWSFNLTQQADEKIALDFVLSTSLTPSQREPDASQSLTLPM
ncbi:hypothetical protein CB0940_07633 [Cercospora beticola]|uniref:Uncharacterized protein n=1 Tax=Cercospora beticola TaxID=122368 RepID=A0A2G5HAW7_CERBT|nr:hypothetical protein CB0940_07633 [Cercospora beticola]PIA89423.1 hypothetical protein CB0940_07633 [Cercospora beticola]WPB03598.1 hypothetical protein RHO25_008238 [Cercospora beticola]